LAIPPSCSAVLSPGSASRSPFGESTPIVSVVARPSPSLNSSREVGCSGSGNFRLLSAEV
jgi:hypothetical protein